MAYGGNFVLNLNNFKSFQLTLYMATVNLAKEYGFDKDDEVVLTSHNQGWV